jgi:hypothetical protein
MADSQPSEDWSATWKDSSKRLLDAALAATPAQRLQWLEEAMALAYAAGTLSSRRDADFPGNLIAAPPATEP